MMARKLITAILGFKPEKKKDTLVLRVKNAGNQTVDIEVHAATLAPLAASVMAAMPMFDEPGAKHFLSQPLTLTGCQPFVRDDDKVGLSLVMDKGIRFPVVFERVNIQPLIDQLEKLKDARPEAPSKLN